VSRTRSLRVDNTAPTLRVSLRRMGRMLAVRARAADSRGKRPTGLSRILFDPGNGRWLHINSRYTHVYSRSGTYQVRVRAVDRAGNARTVTRRLRVG